MAKKKRRKSTGSEFTSNPHDISHTLPREPTWLRLQMTIKSNNTHNDTCYITSYSASVWLCISSMSNRRFFKKLNHIYFFFLIFNSCYQSYMDFRKISNYPSIKALVKLHKISWNYCYICHIMDFHLATVLSLLWAT